MIEVDPFETLTQAITGRGQQVGAGLLFIVTQLMNLEDGSITLEGRPLRENHQYHVHWDPSGARTVMLDGLTVILTREALMAYRRNYQQNPKLGHTVVTAVILLDATDYRTFLLTGTLPKPKESA